MPGNSGSEQIRSASASLTGRLPGPRPSRRRPPCGGSAPGSARRGRPRGGEVLAQRVALLAAHHEQVVDVVGAGGRTGSTTEVPATAVRRHPIRLRRELGEPLVQPRTEPAAFLVPAVQARQLAPQHRRLQGIQARRRADQAVVVARALAVCAQQPHAVGQLGRRGHDRAAVAPRAEVLGGVEAEAAERPERADAPAAVARAVGLAGVLDDVDRPLRGPARGSGPCSTVAPYRCTGITQRTRGPRLRSTISA